jgi:hypothetical protein
MNSTVSPQVAGCGVQRKPYVPGFRLQQLYMDLNLKKYMESVDPVGMPPELIKVSIPCPFVVCADIAAKFLRTTPPVAELHVPDTCRHRFLPRAPRPAP